MRDKTISIIDGFFVFLLTVCSLHCFSSSFEIEVSLLVLILFTSVFTVIFSLSAVMLKGKLRYSIFLSVTLIIVILFGFLGKNTLIAQLNYVVNKVIYAYSGYLPIVSRVSFSSFTAVSANSLFTMLSLSLSCLLSFLLIRRRRAFLAIICIIILIVPCFVLVDTLPSILSLLIVYPTIFHDASP